LVFNDEPKSTGRLDNVNFTQTMTVRCSDLAKPLAHAEAGDAQMANADINGYAGSRVLADRHDPGTYVIVADFAQIDPEASAAEEARLGNDRAETHAGVARLRAILDDEIVYHDYDEVYRTDR
jgi:hypothetical protein